MDLHSRQQYLSNKTEIINSTDQPAEKAQKSLFRPCYGKFMDGLFQSTFFLIGSVLKNE